MFSSCIQIYVFDNFNIQEITRICFSKPQYKRPEKFLFEFQNISNILFVSPEKNYFSLRTRYPPSPLIADMSVKNVSFFWTAPLNPSKYEKSYLHCVNKKRELGKIGDSYLFDVVPKLNEKKEKEVLEDAFR